MRKNWLLPDREKEKNKKPGVESSTRPPSGPINKSYDSNKCLQLMLVSYDFGPPA